MANTRIIYEKGVEIRRHPDGYWYYPYAYGEDGNINNINTASVQEELGLRPIVLEASTGLIHKTTLLLPCAESIDETLMSDGKTFFTLPTNYWFDEKINDLFVKMIKTKAGATSAEKVAYTLYAVSYHCQRLAEAYSKVHRDFTMMKRSPGVDANDSVLFSANLSPWIEFDALVTAVRRAYDSARYILWNAFGSNGGCPRAFYKTYPSCQRLPNGLKERLESSWKGYGLKITAYRDNVQHYTNMDHGQGSVKMITLSNSQWGAKVLLPENPEVQSKDKFEYKQDVDALAYGWEIACEVLEVATAIVIAVETSESKN